jgi:hypothetical protein
MSEQLRKAGRSPGRDRLCPFPMVPFSPFVVLAACATPETPTSWEGGSSVPLINPCPLLLPRKVPRQSLSGPSTHDCSLTDQPLVPSQAVQQPCRRQSSPHGSVGSPLLLQGRGILAMFLSPDFRQLLIDQSQGQKQILPPAQSGTNQPSTRPIHCRCTNGLV